MRENRHTYFFLRAMFTLALLFSSIWALDNQTSQFEGRYLWVVRNTLTTKQGIDRMLEFATLNRFNHLLVQVRGRGDAYYNSDIVPKSHFIQQIDFDPLNYLIPKAKEKGINVHAWVNTYILWSSNKKPLHEDHILYKNPKWMDQNNNLEMNINNELKKNNYSNNGYEGLYLAPNHPKVNSYLVQVFRELIENYDLDGLHLDYVRYQDSEYGQNPQAIEYYSKYNNAIAESDISKMNPSELSLWSSYRRKSVTDLVKETKKMLNYVNPTIELTAAVKPNLYQARERFFQEWDVWIAAGYIDKVLIMNYAKDLKVFASNIDIIYDNLPSKYWGKMVMGIATYNQSPIDVINKIKYSKVTRFKSISFFSYNVIEQNPRYFPPIKKILYPK